MSPLVKGHATTSTPDTAKTVRRREHIRYVPPSDLDVGMEIVKPTPAQMADLKQRFPEEYGEGGIGLEFGPWKQSRKEVFTEVPWQRACEMVAEAGALLEDEKTEKEGDARLAEFFRAEVGREPPRKSVMKALFQHGVEQAREYFG